MRPIYHNLKTRFNRLSRRLRRVDNDAWIRLAEHKKFHKFFGEKDITDNPDINIRLPVDFHFDGYKGQSSEKEKQGAYLRIMAAVLILSQRKSGRKLLKTMYEDNCSITVDFDSEDENLRGYFLFKTKNICINPHHSPEEIACTIAHEGRHYMQSKTPKLDERIRPQFNSSLIADLACEADARAFSIQNAFELASSDPDGPKVQILFTTPLFLQVMLNPFMLGNTIRKEMAFKTDKDEDIQKRFVDELIAQHPESDLRDGTIMAQSFTGFLRDDSLKKQYQESYLKWAECIDDFVMGYDKTFSNPLSPEEIKGALVFSGIAYLNEHAPDVGLDDATFCGLDEELMARLKTLFERRKKLYPETSESHWTLPAKPKETPTTPAGPS